MLTCIPTLLHTFFNTFTEAFHIWDNYVYVEGVSVVAVVASPVSTGLDMGLNSAMPVVDFDL